MTVILIVKAFLNYFLSKLCFTAITYLVKETIAIRLAIQDCKLDAGYLRVQLAESTLPYHVLWADTQIRNKHNITYLT